jgi:ubiquinone/menaquinone biosynthesis C-methylase UbiE
MTNIVQTWARGSVRRVQDPEIPLYLEQTYWWAYVRPQAIRFWDRSWLVNLILFGNFDRLRDAALKEFDPENAGSSLQISCVYNDISVRLAERVTRRGGLDIVDIVPAQLENVRRKLVGFDRVRTIRRDASKLKLPDASYDQVLLFFLLHEVPDALKGEILSEALRVIKPGGKLVIVDYDRPSIIHPLRPLLHLVLKLLEPFALVLWRRRLETWLPAGRAYDLTKETFFGGMYQKIVVRV